MKSKLLIGLLVAFFALGTNTLLFAQGKLDLDLQKRYNEIVIKDKDKADNFLDDNIDPLLDLFGFYTGGGLYHTADVHSLLGFDVGVRVVAMRVVEDQKLGSKNKAEYGVEDYEGPLGEEGVIPLPLLHASVGLPGNVEAMARFFTYPIGQGEADSLRGNITLIGLGVKYGLIQSIALPRVAIIAAYHYLGVPEEFDFASINNISLDVIVSKGIPFVNFYGGVGLDRTKLKVEFETPMPPPYDRFSKEFTKTNFRGTLGLTLSPLPFININADYNFGKIQGFDLGVSLSFR